MVGLLIALVVFSFLWYFITPLRSLNFAVADTAEGEEIASVEPFYVLVIGSDTRRGTALYTGNAADEGQLQASADLLTLVRVGPQDKKITLLSVPAATLCVDTSKTLASVLNTAGPEDVLEEVQKLVGVNISSYVLVTFAGFEALVDAVGGVTIDVEQAASVQDPATGTVVSVSPGTQRLNGAQALAVVCCWELDEAGDVVRQTHARAIQRALLRQAITGDEQAVRRLLGTFASNVSTNINDALLVSVALDYAAAPYAYTVYSGTGPYIGQWQADGSWAILPDQNAWHALMQVVDAGQNPMSVLSGTIEPEINAEETD